MVFVNQLISNIINTTDSKWTEICYIEGPLLTKHGLCRQVREDFVDQSVKDNSNTNDSNRTEMLLKGRVWASRRPCSWGEIKTDSPCFLLRWMC